MYKRLFKYILQYRLILFFGIFGTVLYSAMDAVFIYSLKPILNEGFINRDQNFIRLIPGIIFVIILARGLSSLMSSYYMSYLAKTIIMDFRKEIFAHYLRSPAKAFSRNTSGKLLSKLLYDTEQVSAVGVDACTNFLQSLFFVIGLLTVMFVISAPLTIIFLLILPGIFLSIVISNSSIRRSSNRIQDAMVRVTEIAKEGIEGYREIKMFGVKQYEEDKFAVANEKARNNDVKYILVKSINTVIVQSLAALGIAAIVYCAVNPVDFFGTSALSAGGFTSLMSAMLAMLKPLKHIISIHGTIQRGLIAANSIFMLLDSEQEHNNGTMVIEQVSGNLQFNNVTFSYPSSSQAILKDISIKIPAGQTVALVGGSGSGKSTIVNLIPRFYEVINGNITLDNINLQDLDLEFLRKQISIVSQRIVLFNDSIINNIAYSGSETIDYARAIDAANKAHIMEFVNTLEDGLDTIVGENGLSLSGGQRQRIAIARAIYKNAPILILDEATSALDYKAEVKIQKILNEIMQNRTTIVIAHRLSTIQDADHIFVIDNGVVVEQGNHYSLLEEAGYYYQLYNSQFEKHAS